LKCPVCGADNAHESRYCSLCYNLLPASATPPDVPFDPIWHEAPADPGPVQGGAVVAGFIGGQQGGQGFQNVAGVPPAYGSGGGGGPGGPPGPPPRVAIMPDSNAAPPPVDVLANASYWQSTLGTGTGQSGWSNMSGGQKGLLAIILATILTGLCVSMFFVLRSASRLSNLSGTTSDLSKVFGKMENQTGRRADLYTGTGSSKAIRAVITYQKAKGFHLQQVDENGAPVKIAFVPDYSYNVKGYLWNDPIQKWTVISSPPELDIFGANSDMPSYSVKVTTLSAMHNGTDATVIEFEDDATRAWPWTSEYLAAGTGKVKVSVWCPKDMNAVSDIEITNAAGVTMTATFSRVGERTLDGVNLPSEDDYY
jgi:hypothetical protein